MTDFHRLPGKTPEIDTNLQPDELILSIDLPASPYARHSHYLKIRDRASYAFALVSVAAALELDGDQVRTARIALGGVAHKPCRAEEAEKALTGKQMSADVIESAAKQAVAGAKAYQYNSFKIEMAKQGVIRALQIAGGAA
jgi:xanthine dehydrogenase YagS FAD-binding subunit